MSVTNANADEIEKKLEEALNNAKKEIMKEETLSISDSTAAMIESFSCRIENARTAFTNIVTCLVCKAVDNNVDPRYHRKPGNGMPEPPSGRDFFSGRSISEKVVAPWLKKQGFITSHSGWQTRVFERPKPYVLDYEEHIAYVREEFLGILDAVASDRDNSLEVLTRFFVLQIRAAQEAKELSASLGNNSSYGKLIQDIVNMFQMSFELNHSSRLPVLAMHSCYSLIMGKFERYKEHLLLPLKEHSAADIRTGSVGDIEIADNNGIVVEGVEVKHKIKISRIIVDTVLTKLKGTGVRRFYILTTHNICTPSDIIQSILKKEYELSGREIIVNGIIPTIKYYLRLVENPAGILPIYEQEIIDDTATSTEHLSSWKEIRKQFE